MSHRSESLRAFEDALIGTIRRVAPPSRVQELDAAKVFDADLYDALAKLGVYGLGVDEKFGGAGGGALEQIHTLRILANLSTSMAVFTVVQFLITRLLSDNANEAQKRAYLTPLARGEMNASFCLTEAGGGTDVLASMKTSARRVGGNFVLSGEKMWISGAATSDYYVVLARTSLGRVEGISTFIVPSDTAGISVSQVQTFAINGYNTCRVSFDDVVIGAEQLVGVEGQGFRQVFATLNAERINCAAVALGMAQGAMETAVEYARNRPAFNKSLAELQSVQHKLANVATAIELAWGFVVAIAKPEGVEQPLDIASSMAKLAASNAAKLATDVGMEIMGAAGFDLATPMQRYYRDHRLYAFAPVADDMCRNLIAERYFRLPRSF